MKCIARFYKNKNEEGKCLIDMADDSESIFGDSGIVAAFRVYCMLEHFSRKGWIRCRVAEFSVLDTIDQPATKIELTLTGEGLRAGNSILWRNRLQREGQN